MSRTKIADLNNMNIKEDAIREAVYVLRSGGLVIIPTETVYGVAADLMNKKALEKLYEIKKRPKDKPFSIAIDRKEKVEDFCRDIPVAGYKLMDRFWPGALTLILKGINQPNVGLRIPDDAIALKIIAGVGNPLVLPSANLSGKSAPVTFEAAIWDLNGLVDFAIDAGPVKLGIESSIVDFTVEPVQISRAGAISKEEINKVIGKKNILFVCTGNSCRSVMAEALFKKMMRDQNRDDVNVSSAGIMSLHGLVASQGAKEVLAKEGIDVSRHIAHEVTKEMLLRSDFILVMERLQENAILKIAAEVKNRVFLLKEFAKIDENNLDIEDPMGKPVDFYEETFASIKEALERVSKLI